MDMEKTLTAEHSLPLSSIMIVFLLTFYRKMKTHVKIKVNKKHDTHSKTKIRDFLI